MTKSWRKPGETACKERSVTQRVRRRKTRTVSCRADLASTRRLSRTGRKPRRSLYAIRLHRAGTRPRGECGREARIAGHRGSAAPVICDSAACPTAPGCSARARCPGIPVDHAAPRDTHGWCDTARGLIPKAREHTGPRSFSPREAEPFVRQRATDSFRRSPGHGVQETRPPPMPWHNDREEFARALAEEDRAMTRSRLPFPSWPCKSRPPCRLSKSRSRSWLARVRGRSACALGETHLGAMQFRTGRVVAVLAHQRKEDDGTSRRMNHGSFLHRSPESFEEFLGSTSNIEPEPRNPRITRNPCFKLTAES